MAALMREGRPQAQAVAIALEEARRSGGGARGVVGLNPNRAGDGGVKTHVVGSGPYSTYYETGSLLSGGGKVINIHRYKTLRAAKIGALQLHDALGVRPSIMRGGIEVAEIGPSGPSWLEGPGGSNRARARRLPAEAATIRAIHDLLWVPPDREWSADTIEEIGRLVPRTPVPSSHRLRAVHSILWVPPDAEWNADSLDAISRVIPRGSDANRAGEETRLEYARRVHRTLKLHGSKGSVVGMIERHRDAINEGFESGLAATTLGRRLARLEGVPARNRSRGAPYGGVGTATRYSGRARVRVSYDDRTNQYRAAISVLAPKPSGGHAYVLRTRQVVGRPPAATGSVDSADAFYEAARAALSFAMHEDKIDPSELSFNADDQIIVSKFPNQGGAGNRAGSARPKKIVRTMDEFLDAIDGREATLDGVHGRFKVERGRRDQYGPLAPSHRIWFKPSERGKRSPQYLETRAKLHDDFDVDLTSSDRLFTEVAPRLGIGWEN